MAKRISARRIKAHTQYTYEQAADALGVSVHTVRTWRGAGLEVLDSQKPHLILGFILKSFLESRVKAKRTLAPDQFLCMTCNTPRRALGSMADYVPLSDQRGRLEALCEACEGRCFKFTNPARCTELSGILDIAMRDER